MTRASLERGQHPVTLPVSLFYALDRALDMLLAEGLEAIFARHKQLGEYIREQAQSMGLHVLADGAYASNTVTAVCVPDGIDATVLLNRLCERDQVVLAAGQDQLAEKILRIAHMGWCDIHELIIALNCLRVRLQELGFATNKPIQAGAEQ